MTSKRIVLAGGGSAGHVNPLLVMAKLLESQGYEISVLGTKEGLEATLVPQAGFELRTVEKVPLPRKPSKQLFTLPSRLKRAVAQAAEVVEGAHAVIGFGGYVSTPAYQAANKLDVPIVIHEQNAKPGLANRLGARTAKGVGVTFAGTPLRAKQGLTEVTGLPLRAEIERLAQLRTDPASRLKARQEAAAFFALDPSRQTLLVTGGSLGAQHLNQAVTRACDHLPQNAQVIHITGKGKIDEVNEAISHCAQSDRWVTMEYLDSMEQAFALADLVLCRSGAGTVAELSALGIPAIYVPLPIGNGEQRLNASDVLEKKGAFLVEDREFSASTVQKLVFKTLENRELLAQMEEGARLTGVLDGAQRLQKLIEAVVR